MKYLTFLCTTTLFVFLGTTLAAQNSNITIAFKASFTHKNLQLDSTIYLNAPKTDSISFSNFKFYITNIKLLKSNKIIYAEKNSYHLINYRLPETTEIILNTIKAVDFDAMQFDLGVDSITNNNGIGINDLDPLKGMYWAWHSGYINFKIEGRSNICKTRNNEFEFHLGGFLNGFYALQNIQLNTTPKKQINIDIAIDKFINTIDLSSINHIMMPSKQAIDLSKIASGIFSIKE